MAQSTSEIPVLERGPKDEAGSPPKTASFWLSLLAITIATFLAALDTSAVSTALPTIVNHFQGQQFVWIGSAYTLAGVAFLPLSGHFANLFGRRPVLLIGLALFAVGSALCGAATSMAMLIGGRTVQGLGSGVILALTEIILADLVPLSERGAYQGAIGLIWSIASIIGPLVLAIVLSALLVETYAAIPQIKGLAEPMKGEVRAAFTLSLDVLWEVMIGIGGLGFLSAWLMREVGLQQIKDENWGLNEQAGGGTDTAATTESREKTV